MAYDEEEVDKVKSCVQEIIDESFKGVLHELRKKLTASEAKVATYSEQVASYKKDLERLKECHRCHGTLTDRQDSQTQCNDEDFKSDIPARDASASRPAKPPETTPAIEKVQQRTAQQQANITRRPSEIANSPLQTNGNSSSTSAPECIDLVDDSD